MNLKTLKSWLKKNKNYLILSGIIILLVSWIAIREKTIVRQSERIEALNYDVFQKEIQRMKLDLRLKALQIGYDSISESRDSLKIVLDRKDRQLLALREKHKHLLDSISNIPPDSVYKNLGDMFPNTNNMPLLYPFSSSQIVPIYRTAISYSILNREYEVQGEVLNACKILNMNYESGEENLNTQIRNLKAQIGLADGQIADYEKEVKLLNRRVSKHGFWNKTLFTTTAIATGIAILK